MSSGLEVGLWRRGPLTDAATILVAAGAAIGALSPCAAPVPLAAGAVVLAVGLRRAVLVAVALGLLTSALASQAWSGLTPVPTGPFDGVVVLVGDPQPSFGGWRADVRTRIGRLELTARGGAGGRLGSRHAGERVAVSGRTEGLTEPARAATRHVRGRLVATGVVPVDAGTPIARIVEAIRSLVLDGAASLPTDQRALFTGFVLGDDTGASVAQADDFDGAGLSHLLVVSGQNVVFVVAVATPLLARLRRRGRFAATVAVLLLFAAVTRFEPSVLRATGMAVVGAVAVLLGRPVTGVRVLALAVTALLVLDPLLIGSLGFRLSTAASAGILVLARPLAAALPGPAWLRLASAVTLSAQVAVAPLLVPAFGPMPVAALPANLVAEPVAGLVMMWGCTGGLLAGLVPSWAATVLHLPTRAGLWWVASVARAGADAPLGRVGLLPIAAATAALAGAVVLRRRQRRRVGVALVAVAALTLLGAPRASPSGPPTGMTEVGGAELWHGDGGADLLVVPGNARADDVLAGLRARRVGRLDLVILRSPGPTAAELLRVLRQRIDVDLVWAPRGSPAPRATAPPTGPVSAGGLQVRAWAAGERLEVEVAVGAPPAGGGEGAVGDAG